MRTTGIEGTIDTSSVLAQSMKSKLQLVQVRNALLALVRGLLVSLSPIFN